VRRIAPNSFAIPFSLAGLGGLWVTAADAGGAPRAVGEALFLVGSWFTGQLIYAEHTLDQLHPGYFIPTVAGGLLASVAAAQIGQTGLAWVLFGYGMIAWLVIGSIILGRLFFGPRLPEALVPTLAIQVAPGAVASLAWFSLDGGRIDTVACGARAAGGAGGVRAPRAGGRADQGARQHREHAVPGHADAPGRDGGLVRAAAGRAGHPRLHDRCQHRPDAVTGRPARPGP
jgi:hypothetical protein